jgi:16S rRNA (guanine527-N7)-methyltransferase
LPKTQRSQSTVTGHSYSGAGSQSCKVAWDRLAERARALFGVELNQAERDQLGHYVELVWVWSRRTNLVSVRSWGEIVDRHVLDSIAPLNFVREAMVVADFGSGAGFPAIPLAILSRATRFHLVEPRHKRATFLRHVARTLDLGNAQIHERRGEEWRPEEAIDLTLGRAVRVGIIAELSLRVLSSNGRLIVMRKRADCELRLGNFREVARVPYELPGGERHELVVFQRANA